MIYFTKYAEQKFELLNKHKVYITKEDIKEAVLNPDNVSTGTGRVTTDKDGIRVIYQEDGGIQKILTFYPIKQII